MNELNTHTRFWRVKLLSYLHDLPDKTLNIPEHEEKAEQAIKDIFGSELDNVSPEQRKADWDIVKKADIWASMTDRLQLPKGSIEEFRPEKLLFVHPFSGKELDFNLGGHEESLISKINNENIRTTISAEFIRLKEQKKWGRDFRRMFFSLFYILKNDLSAKYRNLCLLPADTRNPNHTIFQHLDLCSAFAGARINPETGEDDKPCLFSFWTTGVQNFIKSARSSRDLWAGSYWLSAFVAHIIARVARDLGPDSILAPDIHHQQLVSYLIFGRDNWEEMLEDGFGYPQDKLSEFIDPEQFIIPNLPNMFTAIVPESWLLKAEDRIKSAVKEFNEELAFGLVKLFADKYDAKLDKEKLQKDLSGSFGWDFAGLSLPDNEEFEAYREVFLKNVGSIDIAEKVDLRSEMLPEEMRYKGKAPAPSAYHMYSSHLATLREEKKRWRHFSQNEGAYDDKCSIGSGLEILCPPGAAGEGSRKFWDKIHKINPVLVKDKERLGPVGAVKRFFFDCYMKEKMSFSREGIKGYYDRNLKILRSYPSLEDISLSGFKMAVSREIEAIPEIKPYLQAAENLSIEIGKSSLHSECKEQLYLAEFALSSIKTAIKERNLTPEYTKNLQKFMSFGAAWFSVSKLKELLGKEISASIGADIWRTYEKSLSKMRKKILQDGSFDSELPFLSNGRYYAVLMFDGDSLSKWLQGEQGPASLEQVHPDIRDKYCEAVKGTLGNDYAKIKDYCAISPAYHKSISEALGNFSVGVVREIVEKEFYGRLIYSGGDDVLALLSPEKAVACAHRIAELFSRDFLDKDEFCKAATPVLMGSLATGSCGIVFSPLRHPFALALDEARDAEKGAKNAGKNGYELRVLRHGGNSLIYNSKWQDDGLVKKESSLLKLIEHFQSSALSKRFPYALRSSLSKMRSEFSRLRSQTINADSFYELVETEIKRLCKQHSVGEKSVAENKLLLLSLWEKARNSCETKDKKAVSFSAILDKFFGWLDLTLFLTRMGQEENND